MAAPGTSAARPATGPVLVPVTLVGLALIAAAAVAVASSDRITYPGPTAAAAAAVGAVFLAVGAWATRQGAMAGRLFLALAAAWSLAELSASDVAAVETVGSAATGLPYAVLVHLLLALPSGRLPARTDRGVVAAAYGVGVVGPLAAVAFDVPGAWPPSTDRAALAATIEDGSRALGITVVLVAVGLLLTRPRRRVAVSRVLVPLQATGAVLGLLLAADLASSRDGRSAWAVGVALVALALPFAALAVVGLRRLASAGRVSAALSGLAAQAGAGGTRAALAEALGDPRLDVAYWLPSQQAYVDATGRPVPVPPPGRAATTLRRNGTVVAALVHDPALADDPDLVRAVGDAACLALDNERLQAELRARVSELEDSRRRLLEATDAERQRVERDLHDGAQQRLVALRVDLGLAAATLSRDPAAAQGRLERARADLDVALDDLRRLARGLNPAVLDTHGLAAALASLASRSPVPVHVEAVPDEPLPSAVERAVYFVVAEALTNVAKHAVASSAAVRVLVTGSRADRRVTVEIDDDGRGGADPAGAGLRGLAARVASLDGKLSTTCGSSGGTRLRAVIPVESTALVPDGPEQPAPTAAEVGSAVVAAGPVAGTGGVGGQ